MVEPEIDRNNTSKKDPGKQAVFTTESVFDKEELLLNIGGDTAILDQIVALFLDDAWNQLEALKEAFENRDADAVKRQAHRLKGASANIRAGRLRKVFLEIEEAAGRSELSGNAGLLAVATSEFEQFRIRASGTNGCGDGGR